MLSTIPKLNVSSATWHNKSTLEIVSTLSLQHHVSPSLSS